MSIEEKQIIRRVVENYIRNGSAQDAQVKVTCLPSGKSSLIEQIEGDDRTVQLDEYKSDGKVVWAGFSSRSQTVYLSPRSIEAGSV